MITTTEIYGLDKTSEERAAAVEQAANRFFCVLELVATVRRWRDQQATDGEVITALERVEQAP